MDKGVAFSIIIPHYNVPDLLMRCLDSIPVSEDIQVIVVDDNSPAADTYLEKYPELSRQNLEFIRAPKNGGAGYARNIGLDHAKGKWILFADADDFFVENMYDLISSYKDSGADVIYFKNKVVLSEDTSISADRSSYVNRIIDQYLNDGDEWPLRYKMYGPWCKMIKRSLFVKHNIRFDEIRCFEDNYCSLLIGYHAETIQVVNTVLYVITYRPDSLTAGFGFKPSGLKIRAEVTFKVDKFLFQHHICRERSVVDRLLQMLSCDRSLFRYYFFKLDEIYPSKLAALRDISKGKSLWFRVKLYGYALFVWMRSRLKAAMRV